MADPSVGATLVDDNGKVAEVNNAGSAEARFWFRSIFHDKSTTASTWKLHLQNTSEKEAEVYLVAWLNAAKKRHGTYGRNAESRESPCVRHFVNFIFRSS